MANLIVTVIAIALVAVASLMGAYYGGSAFLQGTSKANAATVVNQGSQIAAAATLYRSDAANVLPADMTALENGQYVSSIDVPNAVGGDWVLVGTVDATCSTALNPATDTAGYACLDMDDTATAICSAINTDAGHTEPHADATAGRFGCLTASTTAYYRL